MNFTKLLEEQIDKTLQEIDNLASLVRGIERRTGASDYVESDYRKPWSGAEDAREAIIKAPYFYALQRRALSALSAELYD